jgi:hypothetical protein
MPGRVTDTPLQKRWLQLRNYFVARLPVLNPGMEPAMPLQKPVDEPINHTGKINRLFRLTEN